VPISEGPASAGPAGAEPVRQIKLVLWRHGQTLWNAERRFQGQSDIELDQTGIQQAERAARLLAALRPAMIISSDLSRAAGTAAPLARLTGLTVTFDKDLRERHGGGWEGLTDAEIRARYPQEHANWMPPDGEPSAVVADRVAAALERAAASLRALRQPVGGPPGGEGGSGEVRGVANVTGLSNAELAFPADLAVVVSHGAALRLGMARLLGLPDDLFGVLGPLSNCAWCVIGTSRGRWRVLEYNAGTLPEPVLGDDR
jgi:broad specificity phosphatase PhoE